jgi:hypothetical protein
VAAAYLGDAATSLASRNGSDDPFAVSTSTRAAR